MQILNQNMKYIYAMGCIGDKHSSYDKKTYHVATYLKYQSTVQKAKCTTTQNCWPIHLTRNKE